MNCRRRKYTNLEAEGQIQAYSDPSHLTAVSSDSQPIRQTSRPVEAEEEVSLAFGSLGSSLKPEQSDFLQHYGAVS